MGNHRLATETERLIRSHPGPVFVLVETPDPAEGDARFNLGAVEAFGVPFDRASCRPVTNTLTPHGQICRSR